MAKEFHTFPLLTAKSAAERIAALPLDERVEEYATFVVQEVDRMLDALGTEGWQLQHIFDHRNGVYARMWRER